MEAGKKFSRKFLWGKKDETVEKKSKPFSVIRMFLCGFVHKGLDFIFVWITEVMKLLNV